MFAPAFCPDFLLLSTSQDHVCGFLSKKAARRYSTPPTLTGNPRYVGRIRWAPLRPPFVPDLSSSSHLPTFRPSLVSRITGYLVDVSIEATAHPSLNGTGQSPYMTQGHLELA